MYVGRFEPEYGLMVGLFTGPTNSDDDFERYLSSIIDADRRGVAGKFKTLILVVERNNPAPNARWRKRIADETAHIRTEDVLFVMCAESPLIRGVVTAINWIRPPRYEVEIVGKLADVHEILRERNPEAVPAFITAMDELRAEARR